MSELTAAQKYGFNLTESTPTGAIQIEQTKAAQQVQVMMLAAKRFPRNESDSFSKIMNACKRPVLAEEAMYAYPKGGSLVKGPSIRLAEAVAQNWGNIYFGVEELSRENGVSFAKSFAWNLETNVVSEMKFQVAHKRDTKNGTRILTDERDIYELIANQGARRKRACILSVIPGDIIDAAVKECEKTLSSSEEPIAERIRKMIMAFDQYGVKVEHLEKRLGHKLDAVIETELVDLRSILKSLKDGMAKREQFFDFQVEAVGAAADLNKVLEEPNNKNKTQKSNATTTKQQESTKTEISQAAKDFFGDEDIPQ